MSQRARKNKNHGRRSTDRRSLLLDEIVAAVRPDTLKPAAAREFTRQYYRHVDIEDLADGDARHFADSAMNHLRFGAVRRPGRARVRVCNPDLPRPGYGPNVTVVEVVTDNMPFLVDSVSMTINDAGYGIMLTIHPVFGVRRDETGHLTGIESDAEQRESFARFEISRITHAEDRLRLERQIRETLSDVRAVVRDWRPMMNRMRRAIGTFGEARSNGFGKRSESIRLLQWLLDENFTFLGYRHYRLVPRRKAQRMEADKTTSLGILKRPKSMAQPRQVTSGIRRFIDSSDLLVITKSAARSTVHRRGYMDCIAIKDDDASDDLKGIHLFFGLFTSSAYSESPRNIPVLRRKVARIFSHSDLEPGSHRGKALTHILEQFPRDELFQASISDLHRTCQGILNLQERRKIRLFTRRDVFGRFMACQVYVPRDRFNTNVRHAIEHILMTAFGGDSVESTATLTESTLARLYLVVQLTSAARNNIEIADIENQIAAAVVTWCDRLATALHTRYGAVRGEELMQRYGGLFPGSYREGVPIDDAVRDIELIDSVNECDDRLQVRLVLPHAKDDLSVRFKLVRIGGLLSLSQVLPILENFGLAVVSERPYELCSAEGSPIALQDVELRPSYPLPDDFAGMADRFQRAFHATLSGGTEDDSLNRLIWLTDLNWQHVAVLRAYSRYLLQTGIPFSAAYIADVICENAPIAALLIKVFEQRLGTTHPDHDPKTQEAPLDAALEQLTSLDSDRILRGLASAVRSTLRTSLFRNPLQAYVTDPTKQFLSLKIDSEGIADLPEPRPRFEIFVHAPHVEGIHLRFGFIARGGLRWSDRREDYRTEVLGLMKAQVVKNAVIVPTGAKGGFVLKPPRDPDAKPVTVEQAYRTFIRGLLEITDNIVDGRIIPPSDVYCRDGEDAYLVVAADKGTASFSDTANSVADDYDFWLGDAFASGGSSGYDHKKMGITARGAWEAVKRHFRELGTDIQHKAFTVAGIGDMSGDVFGNGMLLSRQIRLVAAFNHRHIFIDPDPDAAASFKERRRLFRKTGSGWSDYNTALLSSGGGIFDRQAKRIDLSPQAQALLGTTEASVRPPQLIKMILSMSVDLIWNGGIGTYVKASTESDSDVGDRSNDAVRVNATELRCRVFGEGGNLGLTQRARIEFARGGGLINTDSVDNAGGVDCSDREVNIKILLSLAERSSRLSRARRDRLLVDMTDDVARHVLRNNYLQTQAISVVASHAADRVAEHAALMHALEIELSLDRELEALPTDEDLMQRARAGEGLSRPELSTLISYAKIHLTEELRRSSIPDDEFFVEELTAYFPERLMHRYGKCAPQHPLRREIIATCLANRIVDRMGPSFMVRALADTGASVETITRAFTILRHVFGMDALWQRIEALDNAAPAAAQYSMLFQAARILRQAVYWLLQHREEEELRIGATIESLQGPVRELSTLLDSLLRGSQRKRMRAMTRDYEQLGAPAALATDMARQHAAVSILDVADIADRSKLDIRFVAEVYIAIGRGLNLAWLRAEIERLPVEGRFQATARGNLRATLQQTHRTLTVQRLAGKTGTDDADEYVMQWLAENSARIQRVKQLLLDIQSQPQVDFAALAVAVQALEQLTDAGD